MGTVWRGMLAPLDEPTGDRRRIRSGGLTFRALPFGLKWQRSDNMGHDDSVIIGSTAQLDVGTVAEAVKAGWISAEAVTAAGLPDAMVGVWGRGEMFDDVDPAELPRLAQDVAEARLLTEKKVIGPSIDPGSVTAVLVEEGSDEPITEERLDELLEQAYETGQDPPLETLYTECEIAAATLVAVPAFAECRPFELMPPKGNATSTATSGPGCRAG